MRRGNRKYIIYSVVLLVILSLSVGFSAFQKQLFVNDIKMNVRLQQDVRVSNISLTKTSGDAVTNVDDYNKEKLYGNITFPSTSAYVLYKVDLTNYGNVKSGLLSITNNVSGTTYQICDSNGNNCTDETETQICNGNSCTLGTTKEIYVKIKSTSAGTKNVDLDFDFEPYNNVTYTYFQENTNSFKKEIMSKDSYTVTFTSKPEEVEVSGIATYSYNKNTGVFTISNIETDINLHAKYLATEIAEYQYEYSNPNNYVSFNNTLYRIITKGNIDDGYGNTDERVKIISNSSIGKNAFDTNGNDLFIDSSLRTLLNTTYYNSLSSTAKELIDTWLIDSGQQGVIGNVGIITMDDYYANESWLNFEQFALNKYDTGLHYAIVNGTYAYNVSPSTTLDTHPVVFLKENVLIVGGSGTSTDPYILELSGNGLLANPTVIEGKTLTVTGSSQELVSVTNKVGTVYYSIGTALNENNYSTGCGQANCTTIPTATNVGSYTVYYYIPAGAGYKAKSGNVIAKINGKTYTIAYQKGSNVTSIGKNSDTCTTTGSSLTCSVTLPTITPASGWENAKWYNGANSYNPSTSFTLNSSNSGLTLTAQVTGKTYTATIYYYDGTAIATTTTSCTVTSGSSCTPDIPNTVLNSKSPNNSTYKGLASTVNTMNTASLSLTSSGNYYTTYTKNVTNYYYNTNAYATRTLHRNEYFTSNSAMAAKLATSDSIIQNYEAASGPGNSSWIGLSTGQDTVSEYSTIADAANSTQTTLYTVYAFSIEYKKGANVSTIGATTGTCNVTTSDTSCNVTLPSITPASGYTSVGWSATNGATTGVTGSYELSTNGGSLYANAKASDLTFGNKTITKTFSTSAQTENNAVTAATNGSGNYTYAITAGNTSNYFSLSGRNLTIAASTPANTTGYSITITATDTTTNVTKSATYTIVINKATCPAPTNVTIGTDKKVSWTAATGASSYQISMSANSGFAAHTSGSVYNSITDSTGTRTVYVRSVCSTTNYSSQYSSNASKSTTVYSVTLTKGTGISTVSGNGNYITGATVTLGATVSTGYTWSKWTQTSGGAQVSTTQAYSSTITSNWAYTANATVNALTFAGKTITKTYSTSSQTETNGVNAASNGSGNYSYAITAGNSNNYFSLSGRSLTIAASTPVNTTGYSITITATDTTTGATKDATYTIKINKKKATLGLNSSITLTYPTAQTIDYTYDGDGTVSCSPADTSYVTCSVNTSTKKLTLTPVKPTSSAITVTLSATAGTNYSAPDNKSISVTVNKGTCPAPTNVTIGTDKKVSWTAANGASSYQISMSASSGFAAHTSGSVYSSITDSTGTRTVYVRSVCNTTYYSSQYSSNASKSTTVYSVTLTKGTGISTVSGNGNYITGATVTLGATTSTGYTWSKWTQTSGGSQVSTTNAYSATITSNWAYTANATVNALTFADKTITKTFSTSAQTETNGVNAASNGSGNYSYAITAGNSNNYFSLSGRNLTIAASTPANTTGYSITITATDTTTGATKDATYTIVINKATCPAPTNVTIGTDKKVSWTAATGASSYQISMSASSGFAAHTSGSVYNSITDSTGTRTVYVRSVCSTTNYSSQYSSNASKSTTVYSVTLTKGTGISAVSGNGNYITGATVILGATVSTGYTWSKWTQTSGGAQVSTTNAYSFTINSSRNYTANATVNTLTFANKTITKTFSTSAQTETNGVNAATNGSGTYTYAITAGNTNSYFSLNGRDLTIKANTPANTTGYSITITATDSITGATASATYTIVINKATFTCTTSKGNYDYNGTIGSPSVSTNPGNGTVTYYRNTANSTSGGTAWSGTTSTTLSPGTYYIYATIAASTNYASATCSASSFTVSKGTCTPPTNITIGTDKKVSWTASSTASSYEVCVASGSNTCTPSTALTSGSAYNAITDATGSRTVYVRSVCNSTNYNTPSSNASKSTTVYSVALTAGTGISAVSGAGNYITGASVSIDATVSSGYTWSKWTQTSGGSQVSTTKAYSFTINSNRTYTANAFANNYQNTTTNAYFATLNDAFSAVANNQTIKVLNNVTETTDASLASGKTGIKLDLNGKTITMNAYKITNNGSLDIYNTSSTDGKIEKGSTQVLVNNGTLTLNGYSTAHKVIIEKETSSGNNGAIYNTSSGTLTVNNNVEINVTQYSWDCITNEGTANINGATIRAKKYGISNKSNGVLNISGNNTSISSSTDSAIFNNNSGVTNISAGTITGNNGIYNYSGTVTITGGSITGTDIGIKNTINGSIEISGNSTQIVGTNNYGIETYGGVTIQGGTITGGTDGIYYLLESNYADKDLTISGGTIVGASSGIVSEAYAHLTVSGSAQITGNTSCGIQNTGNATISGGTITGATYGFYNSRTTYDSTSHIGYTTITGGTISGGERGVFTISLTVMRIGDNSNAVSISTPVIQSTNSSNSYGLYANGTCSFYDGIIKSSSGTGYAIGGSEAPSLPTGYNIYKETVSGVENAYLVLANYLNTDTNIYYETLNDAFNAVSNNQTIKVLNNATETTAATLSSGKTGVKLDLNGKTVTLNNVINNNGSLDIYNTSSTNGKINCMTDYVVYNNGNLTLNGTASTNKIIIDKMYSNFSTGVIYNYSSSSTLTMNKNVEIVISVGSSHGITNCGTATIKGGTITATSDGIQNDNGGTLTISGGTITGTSYGINNYSGEINISGSSTQITGTNIHGINNSSGTLNISGGTVTAGSIGINNGGTLIMTGGTVTGVSGIQNNSTGTISGGIITGTGTQNGNYGVQNSATLSVTGGTITSTGSHGFIAYSGTATIDGITITGATNGMYILSSAQVNISGNAQINGTSYGLYNMGTATITGGTITGGERGVYIRSGSFTMGTKDSNVSTSVPLVQTTGTSDNYGIYSVSTTFNFYDGIVKSSSGTGKAMYRDATDTPTGYVVRKTTTNGVESAILNNQYTITYNANGGSGAPSATTYTYASSGTVTLSSTVPTYSGYIFEGWGTSADATTVAYSAGGSFPKNIASDTTLYAVWARWSSSDGFFKTMDAAVSGTTGGSSAEIKLLISYTDTNAVSIDKQLKVNLNSYTLTRDKTITIASSGNVTFNGSGTLTTSTNVPLTNNGTLTLSAGTFTSSGNNYIITNNGTLTVSGATITQTKAYSGVVNADGATMSLTSGTISATSGITDVSAVENRATFSMSGGTISGTTESIGLWHPMGYNGVSVSTITSGTLQSGTDNAAWIQSGTLNANGGTFTANCTSHFTITATAVVKIAGARIVSTSGHHAFYMKSGTVTMSSGSIVGTASYGYSSGYVVGIGGGTFTMTGGTIGADTSSVYGGRAVAIFKDSDGSAGTFTLDGGTVRTYSNSSYNGRTVHLITGTFNYNSGTVSATTSYTDTYQLWRQNGTTFNNPANISLKTLNY